MKRKYSNHGMTGHRVYNIWRKMRSRCYNKNEKYYHRYGGRGIKICDEWLDSSIFIEWALSHGYKDNLTIDRINNDKGYSPDNCEFITQSENSLRRPRNPERGIYKDGKRYYTHLWKTINGVETVFRGGHGFLEREDALKRRDELYNEIELIAKIKNNENKF